VIPNQKHFLTNLKRKARLASNLAIAALASPRYRKDFDGVRTFAIFIGYPRSGGTLMGSLLDAHPNAIIANEANVLKALRYGFNKHRLFYYLLRKSRRFTAAGRTHTGYSYLVPGGWQGRYRSLQVIGDKVADITIQSLIRRPWLAGQLKSAIGIPVRWIHMIRDPRDNIATMFRKSAHGRSIDETVEHYFHLAEGTAWLKRSLPPEEVLDIHIEDLTARPGDTIGKACAFLGLEHDESHIQACQRIVFSAPRRTGTGIDWPPGILQRIGESIQGIPFLAERYAEPV